MGLRNLSSEETWILLHVDPGLINPSQKNWGGCMNQPGVYSSGVNISGVAPSCQSARCCHANHWLQQSTAIQLGRAPQNWICMLIQLLRPVQTDAPPYDPTLPVKESSCVKPPLTQRQKHQAFRRSLCLLITASATCQSCGTQCVNDSCHALVCSVAIPLTAHLWKTAWLSAPSPSGCSKLRIDVHMSKGTLLPPLHCVVHAIFGPPPPHRRYGRAQRLPCRHGWCGRSPSRGGGVRYLGVAAYKCHMTFFMCRFAGLTPKD